MATSYIGVKIADGTYYPIFESVFRGKKRMVLTTVRDDQSSVQIDLYRGEGTEMSSPEYVGTLLVENVEQAAKGEPEITMTIGLDGSGNLNATASDAKTGEYQSLSVSLEALSEDETYDVPDFALDDSSVEGLDEELGEFEQISFQDEDESEESSGHSYDEELPALGDLEEGSAEGTDFDAEQFAEEDEDFSFDNDFENEFEQQEPFGSEEPADEGTELPNEEQFGAPEELGDIEDAEDFGSDEAFAAVASAEEEVTREHVADQNQAPFEDGRIPEQYRPEARSNPFVLGGFILLALAACGIIAYLVYTALQPGSASGTVIGFLGFPLWLSLEPCRRGSRTKVSEHRMPTARQHRKL